VEQVSAPRGQGAKRPGAAVARKAPVPLWRAPDTVACRDQDTSLFYPVEGMRADEQEARYWRAKAMCARCPFTGECLERAMAEEKTGGRYGIRGGLTPDERKRLSKNRSRRPARRRGRPPRQREEAAA